MKIILDTNILIYAAKQKIDLVSQIKGRHGQSAEIIVPNLVKEELESLKTSAKKGSDKQAANLALQIIEFSNLKEIELYGKTDDEIIIWAKQNKAVVATSDRELKRKLKSKGIIVFSLRQKALKKL